MRGRQPLPVLRFSQAWELSKARSLLAYDSRTVSMMQHETFYVHACPWRSHVQGRRFALWDHFRHDETMGCKDRMGVPASLVPLARKQCSSGLTDSHQGPEGILMFDCTPILVHFLTPCQCSNTGGTESHSVQQRDSRRTWCHVLIRGEVTVGNIHRSAYANH